MTKEQKEEILKRYSNWKNFVDNSISKELWSKDEIIEVLLDVIRDKQLEATNLYIDCRNVEKENTLLKKAIEVAYANLKRQPE